MFLLNRGFYLIVLRLDQIQHLLTAQDLKDMRGLTQEVQLEINTAVLNTLESIEKRRSRAIRQGPHALEKRLKTPLPEPRRKK